MHAIASLRIDLQWQDSRLLTTPCRQIWAQKLSIASSASPKALQEQQQAATYYWLPSLSFANQITQSSTRTVVGLTDTTAWLQPESSSAGSECSNGCAQMTYSTKLEAAQPYRDYKDYKAYPFDNHVVVFRFGVEDGIVNCTRSVIQNLTQLTRQELALKVQPLSGGS